MSPATKRNRRVLGIDPGLGRMGWAILEHQGQQPVLVGCGCLETAATTAAASRLQQLYDRLGRIIAEYGPQAIAIEKLYFGTNVTTAMSVSQARGVVLLSAAQGNLTIHEFSPSSVKSSVTGDGRADKQQMGRMVKMLLKLKQLPRHDDTTDAIAIALCGLSANVVH